MASHSQQADAESAVDDIAFDDYDDNDDNDKATELTALTGSCSGEDGHTGNSKHKVRNDDDDDDADDSNSNSILEKLVHQVKHYFEKLDLRSFLDRLSEKAAGQAFLSAAVFAVTSITMVLANKAIPMIVDESYRSHIPQITVVWFQCLVALICVEVAKFFNVVEYPSFSLETAQQWLPVNLFFISMICSGFLSIFYCSLPIVTVFKNLTNIITIAGDIYIFKEEVNYLTKTAVLIMTIGAIMSSFHDLEFSPIGYFWMTVNLFSTAGYVLYMRQASSSIKLPKFGMVFYNNLLSVVILFPICLLMGEFKMIFDPVLMTPSFILVNLIAGLFGFYLNFASLWCVSATSATTYSIVGTLNKVPITILGFILFNAKMTVQGIYYIAFATLGGFLFAYSKMYN